MSVCNVCFKKNIISNLKTIGEQIVCSLSCVRQLKSNTKDSCNNCKYPVWKDNYYIINNKYYCSEICKNKIIKQLNIPYNSKLIQHFQEHNFSNNNDIHNIDLKNSKQLREEVLKFYKDFQFDTIIDEEYENNNYTNEIDKNKKYKKIIKNKEYYYKNYNTYNNNRAISSNTHKHTLTKNYTSANMQEKVQKNLINKTRNINIDKYKNNISNFKTTINNQNNVKKNKNENIFLHSEKDLTNKYNKYMNNNHINSYSFYNITDNSRMISSFSFNTTNNYYNNNLNVNKNGKNNLCSKNPIVYNKKKQCINCGNILGHVKILDRNNNAFCSDYCKEYYLSCYK